MSAPLTWSLRSAHALLRTAARLSFRPSKLHLVVESTREFDPQHDAIRSRARCGVSDKLRRRLDHRIVTFRDEIGAQSNRIGGSASGPRRWLEDRVKSSLEGGGCEEPSVE